MQGLLELSFQDLPTVNAFLNGLSAIFLLTGYIQIRSGKPIKHKFFMMGAFTISIVFLICYLIYHYQVGSVGFKGQGYIRPVYFTILISHTILAALVPPLAIIAIYRAFKGQLVKHKKIARWTFPIWLYVSITGVIIYLMLYVFFPSV